MAEAFGSIIIYAPEHLLDAMSADSDRVSWESLAALFDCAGIPSLKDAHSMLRFYEGKTFSHEGLRRRGGALEVTIFGEEWTYVMQALVDKGTLEAYGYINHEYGYEEYYARDDQGATYFQVLDFEGDDEVDEEAVRAEWLAAVPERVKQAFPSAFDFDS